MSKILAEIRDLVTDQAEQQGMPAGQGTPNEQIPYGQSSN